LVDGEDQEAEIGLLNEKEGEGSEEGLKRQTKSGQAGTSAGQWVLPLIQRGRKQEEGGATWTQSKKPEIHVLFQKWPQPFRRGELHFHMREMKASGERRDQRMRMKEEVCAGG